MRSVFPLPLIALPPCALAARDSLDPGARSLVAAAEPAGIGIRPLARYAARDGSTGRSGA